MRNINILKSRVTGILVLLLAPMFLIQVLPSLIYMTGLNIVMSSIVASFVTILLSLLFSKKACDSDIEKHVPKPGVFIVCGFLMIVFLMIDQTLFLWISNHIMDPGMTARTDAIGSMDLESSMIWYLLYAVIIAPVSEECLFRICLYRYLKKSFSWMGALVASSIMFGLIHMTISHLVTATLFGMLLCLILERTKCIWITIICHMWYNFCTLFVPTDAMSDLAGHTVITVLVFFAVVYLLAVGMLKQDARFREDENTNKSSGGLS